MATKNYAYMSFSARDVVTVVIDGHNYVASQVIMSFAINQMPEAVCVLAVGRNVATLEAAAVHDDGGAATTVTADGDTVVRRAQRLRAMKKAQIYFHPAGEFKPDGTPWPDKRILIFDGYYVGFGYPKINGRVSFSVNLIHWLADLGFSSALSSISHPDTPVDISTYPMVIASLTNESGTNELSGFIGALVGDEMVLKNLSSDIWAAIRGLLCAISAYPGFIPGGVTVGGVISILKSNNRAGRALARIEGPKGQCGEFPNTNYRYGVPLVLAGEMEPVKPMISYEMTSKQSVNIAHQTMWDLLIGDYCLSFGLDLCPMIDRAVVVASLPGYRGKADPDNPRGDKFFWRDIDAREYAMIDENAMIPKPLRGVVVHGSTATEAGAGSELVTDVTGTGMAGAFASKAEDDSDGAIFYQPLPGWMSKLSMAFVNAGSSTGTTGKPINSATTPGAKKEPPPTGTISDIIEKARPVCSRYAQLIFIQNALRGRSATISGKLRFDIAPGSHVRILGSAERFMAGSDALAAPRYAQVNRVTIEIDSEARRAATSFVLTHMRNEQENKDERTSIADHPFYGDSVMLGAALTPDLDIR